MLFQIHPLFAPCMNAILFSSLLMFSSPAGAATSQPASASAKLSNPEAVKGVWILAGNSGTAIDNIADLEALRPNLDEALSMEGVKGFSMRVTWRSIENDLSLLDAGKKIADEKHLAFSLRFLAGYRTPESVFEAGSPYYMVKETDGGGGKVPVPFMKDGSPNVAFEKSYEQMLQRLVPWCKANGVRLLHCPWYGHAWAELNNAVDVRNQPGYTYDRWFDAHIRLLNIGLKYADDDLAVEYPMSGGGPTADSVSQIADYVWDKLGPNNPRFFLQANGWGPGGYWGSPNPETEKLKSRCFERPVLRGLQSIRQGDYDWTELFAKLRAINATYCEIYAETLQKKNVDQMKAEIRKFAQSVEQQTPMPPAGERHPRQLTMWPKTTNAEAICGTWPTQQVGGHQPGQTSKAQFDELEENTIRPALLFKDVRGFSHRFPWFEIDTSMALAERGLALARNCNVDYCIRFMAGRYTPERVYKAGCRYIEVQQKGPFNDSPEAVTKVPVPFNEDGSPNVVFEREYEKYVAELAGWCRANNVRLLHLAWYGGMWDELYHSQQIRELKGYTYEHWRDAHYRLIDIALRQAGRSLAVEFPFSGHGPTGDTVNELTAYVLKKIGPNNDIFFFQANGWGEKGRWGSPDAEMEALKSRAFEQPVYRALQMIQPQDYDWSKVYQWLYQTHATYAEVYTPSFTMPHKNELQKEITKFAEYCRKNGPPSPASRPME